MKLTEVSTGAHTLKFADYIQHLKDLKVSPKVIGELYSVGSSCLKAGAIFEDSDEDDIRFVFKHGYVQLPAKVESKAFFREKVELYFDHGDKAWGHASHILNMGFKAYSPAEAAKTNIGGIFKKLDDLMQLKDELVEVLDAAR